MTTADNCVFSPLRYHEFDLDKTFQQNLKRKIVVEYPILYVVLEDEVAKYRTEISHCAKSGDLKRSSEVTSNVDIKKKKVVDASDDVPMGDKREQPGDNVTSMDRKDQLADVTHTDITEPQGDNVANANENGNKSGQRNDAVTSEWHEDVRGREWWAENY